jgi:Xaa-Pro aminopeptidase
MNKIGNRIQAVRETMNKQQIDACIITNSDPHMSEYVPEQWKEREWISGFTGSNGVIVLTKQRMALFTDSRYTIQAENELHGTDCVLITTNKIIEDICIWLNNEFSSSNKTIAIRPNVYSTTSIVEIHNKLNHQFSFLFTDIISSVWSNRPKTIAGKTFILEEKFTGKSSSEKLTEIKKIIQKEKIDAYILTALDEIAWLFNIRGNDIPFNPLCYAYAIIEEDKSSIFINIEKTEKKLIEYFNKNQINIHPYNKISEYVKQFSSKKILIDESKINYQLFKTIPNNCAIISRPSYVSKLKSIKNITEIKGIKNVCIKDGVSLVKLSMWIEENINKTISEISIVEKIKEFHQEQELYVGESFDTIAAYQEHGAIVHYKPTLKSNIQIKPEGFLLLDSGAQYMDGTTDITRTIALGELTEQQKTDYTLVLKGHIALASCKFPSGTYGYQLDVLARQFLWENNLNYGHGTDMA